MNNQISLIDDDDNMIFPEDNIPQSVIDMILMTGSNHPDSILNIVTEYSTNKSAENIASFLRDEYGVGGKGFTYDNKEMSVWWNEEGIRISYGKSALENSITEKWDNAANRVKSMLLAGRYAPNNILQKIESYEKEQVAIYFYEVYRNLNISKYPDLSTLFNKKWFINGSYPETVANITEIFHKKENVGFALSIMKSLSERHTVDSDIMRFRFYTPENAVKLLQELNGEHLNFSGIYYKTPDITHSFITEDEINHAVIRGSGVENSKKRITTFFSEHTCKQDRIAFLRQEYGIGGYAHKPFYENHNGQGIEIGRDDISVAENLSWSNVEKRWSEQIEKGGVI